MAACCVFFYFSRLPDAQAGRQLRRVLNPSQEPGLFAGLSDALPSVA
jgi:hypothetical protein